MKMESPNTYFTEPSRCVNCAVRFQRNVRMQLLSDSTANVQQLLRVWISGNIYPQDAVCGNCLGMLQESIATDNTTRRFGYINICLPCGSSISKGHQTHDVLVNSSERNIILQWIPSHQVYRLERVCMPCWLKASRAVCRQRQYDDIRNC